MDNNIILNNNTTNKLNKLHTNTLHGLKQQHEAALNTLHSTITNNSKEKEKLEYNIATLQVYYTTLHYTTLQYTTLHDTTPHDTTLHDITLHYTTLHSTTLHYTTLHYTTLNYATLHYREK